MSVTDKIYVTPKEFIIYGLANGGQILSWNMISSYITYFYTNVFNIDSRAVSLMMLVEGIWDAINDPLMGTIIDRTRTRFGKLRPYLLGVPIPLAITTVALFGGPMLVGDLSPLDPNKITYMVITYFIWEFFYTISDVPFWGLSAAISPNPEERTKAISSARLISSLVGVLPGLLMPIIIDSVHSGAMSTGLRKIFFGFGIFGGVVGMGLFSLSGLFVKERVIQSSEEPSFSECLKGMYTNRPLRILILKDILSSFGGVGGIFSPYYFTDVLENYSLSVVAGIPGAIANVSSYLFIPIFRRHMNNRQILIFLKCIDTLMPCMKYFLGLGGRAGKVGFMGAVLAGEGIINGLLNGVKMVLPTDMLGETVDYSEWTTGKRSEGISFAVATFVGKFNSAISRGLGLYVVSKIGYKTSNESSKVIQTDETKRKIYAWYTIIPAMLGLFGFIPMFFYDLIGEKRERMYRELAEQRKQRASYQ